MSAAIDYYATDTPPDYDWVAVDRALAGRATVRHRADRLELVHQPHRPNHRMLGHPHHPPARTTHVTDKLELHVALRNAEHRNRRLQEQLEAAHHALGCRAITLTALRRAANVRTDAELLDHVRNISVRGVILPTPSAELAAAQAAHRGAEAEVAVLREWQELHSADVRSIRTEMEEAEEQRDEAYAELSALRQALSILHAFTAGKTVLIDE